MTSLMQADQAPPMPDAPVTGPAAWYGPELAENLAWTHVFDADEIGEIEAAVEAAVRRDIDIADIARDDFVLPTLGQKLAAIQDDVVNGRGFVLLRGLPVERWSMRESAVAFFGLGAHFGDAVPQNAKAHVLGHVTDLGNDPLDPVTRIYTTSARQRFHTDSCDIVGLLCLRTAKEGGESSIASSVTIFNEMMKRRPDLAAVLFQPFHIDRKGEVPEGRDPWYRMPVMHWFGGCLTTIFSRDFIEAAQRFADVPRLTPEQVEAMDMLEALAHDPSIRLDMVLAPGDIQFLHNHQILHARTAYLDDPAKKRHLLRLWLSAPNGRKLPPVMAERYGTVEQGTRRGGIRVPGARPHATLIPS